MMLAMKGERPKPRHDPRSAVPLRDGAVVQTPFWRLLRSVADPMRCDSLNSNRIRSVILLW